MTKRERKQPADGLLFWWHIYAARLMMWWRRDLRVPPPAPTGSAKLDAALKSGFRSSVRAAISHAAIVAGDVLKRGWRVLTRALAILNTRMIARAAPVRKWRSVEPEPADGENGGYGGGDRGGWSWLPLTRDAKEDAARGECDRWEEANRTWTYSNETHEQWLDMRDRYHASVQKWMRMHSPGWRGTELTADQIAQNMQCNDGRHDTAHFKLRADRRGIYATIKKSGWLADISNRAFAGHLLTFHAECGDDPLLMPLLEAQDRDWNKHAGEWWISAVVRAGKGWNDISAARENEDTKGAG